jgi:predicted XRE-type DNA-binding protein
VIRVQRREAVDKGAGRVTPREASTSYPISGLKTGALSAKERLGFGVNPCVVGRLRRSDPRGNYEGPFEEIEGDVAMKSAKLAIVRGSGNVFRDLGHENADAEQFKAILAAEIIKALDREALTVRAAHGRTGIAAADFSRIRNADLGRFTVDRLMAILNRLGSRVEVKIRVHRTETVAPEARP